MIAFTSFQRRLTDELQKIEAAILALWGQSEIHEFRNDPYSPVVFFGPRYYWRPLTTEHRAAQADINGKYAHWRDLFDCCLSRHASDIQKDIKEAHDYVASAIELETGWSTEATLAENAAYLAKKLQVFRQLLEHWAVNAPEFILVPDTNALLSAAEAPLYAEVVDSKVFRFVIVPAVLAELDGLKRMRVNQIVGEKAEKAIRVIKGLRKQGSVLEGVTVAKTITVQMIPTEPRMSELPSWLDPNNQDDRITASALEIQRDKPSTVVIVVTDDMNLQNKAEMAFLPWAEAPEPPPKPASPPPTVASGA